MEIICMIMHIYINRNANVPHWFLRVIMTYSRAGNKKLRFKSICFTDEIIDLLLIHLVILLALWTTRSSLWLLHSYMTYNIEQRMILLSNIQVSMCYSLSWRNWECRDQTLIIPTCHACDYNWIKQWTNHKGKSNCRFYVNLAVLSIHPDIDVLKLQYIDRLIKQLSSFS